MPTPKKTNPKNNEMTIVPLPSSRPPQILFKFINDKSIKDNGRDEDLTCTTRNHWEVPVV